MKDKKIEINSINITIGKKEVSLSVKEAKELKDKLMELFGSSTIREYHYPYRWYWNDNWITINEGSTTTTTTKDTPFTYTTTGYIEVKI